MNIFGRVKPFLQLKEYIFLGYMLLTPSLILANNTINTASIAADTISALSQCLHYKVVGVCYWYYYYSVTTTLKVSHYLPDAVVSVYDDENENPWTEINTAYDKASHAVGNVEVKAMTGFDMGSSPSSAGNAVNKDDHLKEVDVIGNPIVATISSNSYMIPSVASAFMPYYQSMIDAGSWRSPSVEIIMYFMQSLTPGLHDIGTWPVNTWGPIYPRTGFIIHSNDAKAAAVTAMRAVHFVTRPGEPHVYNFLQNICGQGCMVEDVNENSDDTQFQMLVPIAKNSCEVFGKNDLVGQEWGAEAAKNAKGAYVYNVWRHYRGCIQGPGKLIGSVDF